MSGLTTERLILRAPVEADWPACRAFLTGPRVAGGPQSEAEARATFDALIGHWAEHGFGPFVLTLKGSDRSLGAIGVLDGTLLWALWEAADEGQGYALEAATVARAEHFLATGESGLVSPIDPADARSVALAERLAARPEPETPAAFAGCATWRHPLMPQVVLTTERLTLRVPEAGDFDAFASWVGSERSRNFGGPGPRDEAREGFAYMLDHWARKGFGYFHVALTETGAPVGRIGISHPAHRAEPEVAYGLYEDRWEGQGLATEAARAARDWAYRQIGLPTLVSYIKPSNCASVALARRLGAKPDGTTIAGDGSTQLVYRHLAPEDRA